MERRIVAAVAVVLAVAVVAMRWPALETIQYVLLVGVLAHCSVCDLRNRVIPNADIAIAVSIRFAYFVATAITGSFSLDEFKASILGGFCIGALLFVLVLLIEHVTGRPGMGGGDIKLYAIAGLYVGFDKAVLVVLVSCILGFVTGFVLPAESNKNPNVNESARPIADRLRRKMPFGPFIALSLLGIVLVGPLFG